jgi:rubredoxin
LVLVKQCKGCGLLFMPAKPTDDRCAQCQRPRPIFDRKPIDLWEQWS